MARKTAEVAITADGRDFGKVFFLTEMPAQQAEKWAMRALLLAAQAGVDIKTPFTGMAGLAIAGIQTIMGVRFGDLEPLLDEMFTCVQVRPDPKAHDPGKSLYMRPLIPEDIEEVATRIRLREAILELHMGFSIADYLSNLAEGSAKTVGDSSPTPTSPKRRERSSHPA